uniref:OTU domain-containing protein n=1 Tax=viral metagenome TaxID=1070528 RepID=A0A6C0C268_9ZZZZ
MRITKKRLNKIKKTKYQSRKKYKKKRRKKRKKKRNTFRKKRKTNLKYNSLKNKHKGGNKDDVHILMSSYEFDNSPQPSDLLYYLITAKYSKDKREIKADKVAINGSLRVDNVVKNISYDVPIGYTMSGAIETGIFTNQKPIVVLNDILIYLQNNNILKNLNDIRTFLLSQFGITSLFISTYDRTLYDSLNKPESRNLVVKILEEEWNKIKQTNQKEVEAATMIQAKFREKTQEGLEKDNAKNCRTELISAKKKKCGKFRNWDIDDSCKTPSCPPDVRDAVVSKNQKIEDALSEMSKEQKRKVIAGQAAFHGAVNMQGQEEVATTDTPTVPVATTDTPTVPVATTDTPTVPEATTDIPIEPVATTSGDISTDEQRKNKIEEMLKQNFKRTLVDEKDDGHCLFRTFARFLYGEVDCVPNTSDITEQQIEEGKKCMHWLIRDKIVEHIWDNQGEYFEWFDEQNPFSEYKNRMMNYEPNPEQKYGRHGGETEIAVFEKLYKIKVIIYKWDEQQNNIIIARGIGIQDMVDENILQIFFDEKQKHYQSTISSDPVLREEEEEQEKKRHARFLQELNQPQTATTGSIVQEPTEQPLEPPTEQAVDSQQREEEILQERFPGSNFKRITPDKPVYKSNDEYHNTFIVKFYKKDPSEGGNISILNLSRKAEEKLLGPKVFNIGNAVDTYFLKVNENPPLWIMKYGWAGRNLKEITIDVKNPTALGPLFIKVLRLIERIENVNKIDGIDYFQHDDLSPLNIGYSGAGLDDLNDPESNLLVFDWGETGATQQNMRNGFRTSLGQMINTHLTLSKIERQWDEAIIEFDASRRPGGQETIDSTTGPTLEPGSSSSDEENDSDDSAQSSESSDLKNIKPEDLFTLGKLSETDNEKLYSTIFSKLSELEFNITIKEVRLETWRQLIDWDKAKKRMLSICKIIDIRHHVDYLIKNNKTLLGHETNDINYQEIEKRYKLPLITKWDLKFFLTKDGKILLKKIGIKGWTSKRFIQLTPLLEYAVNHPEVWKLYHMERDDMKFKPTIRVLSDTVRPKGRTLGWSKGHVYTGQLTIEYTPKGPVDKNYRKNTLYLIVSPNRKETETKLIHGSATPGIHCVLQPLGEGGSVNDNQYLNNSKFSEDNLLYRYAHETNYRKPGNEFANVIREYQVKVNGAGIYSGLGFSNVAELYKKMQVDGVDKDLIEVYRNTIKTPDDVEKFIKDTDLAVSREIEGKNRAREGHIDQINHEIGKYSIQDEINKLFPGKEPKDLTMDDVLQAKQLKNTKQEKQRKARLVKKYLIQLYGDKPNMLDYTDEEILKAQEQENKAPIEPSYILRSVDPTTEITQEKHQEIENNVEQKIKEAISKIVPDYKIGEPLTGEETTDPRGEKPLDTIMNELLTEVPDITVDYKQLLKQAISKEITLAQKNTNNPDTNFKILKQFIVLLEREKILFKARKDKLTGEEQQNTDGSNYSDEKKATIMPAINKVFEENLKEQIERYQNDDFRRGLGYSASTSTETVSDSTGDGTGDSTQRQPLDTGSETLDSEEKTEEEDTGPSLNPDAITEGLDGDSIESRSRRRTADDLPERTDSVDLGGDETAPEPENAGIPYDKENSPSSANIFIEFGKVNPQTGNPTAPRVVLTQTNTADSKSTKRWFEELFDSDKRTPETPIVGVVGGYKKKKRKNKSKKKKKRKKRRKKSMKK